MAQADTHASNPAKDWNNLYQYRRLTQKRYASIWQVPLKKRHHQVVKEHVTPAIAVLEIGAGARNFNDLLQKMAPGISYKSFDVDNTRHHDFYSLADIDGEYDIVCMFEVIEHVAPALALEILETAYNHLKPGGKIFVSTPNTFNPPEYLRDATHITPWCYDELGGVLQLAGFNLVGIYRLYHQAILKKLLKRVIFKPLFQLLGLDFSKQIIAIGLKPEQ